MYVCYDTDSSRSCVLCLPASQHLTGLGGEVLIQSRCAVLQSHQPSLEVWLRIQMHLEYTWTHNLADPGRTDNQDG